MLEASHALGLQNDTATMRIGKLAVDHALKTGGMIKPVVL